MQEHGVEVEVVRYLETGIREDDLAVLAQLENIVRKKEAGPEAMAALQGPDDIVMLLQSNPRALERPVLVVDGEAVIGRPPENVLTLVKKD